MMETKVRQFVLFGTATATGGIIPQDVVGAGLGTGMVNTGGLYSSNIVPNFSMLLGDQQFARIGMRIQNCRCTATINVSAKIYSNTTNSSQYPCDLYMIVLRDRNEKSCIPSELKLQQNGTTYYIDGNAQNAFLPFNRQKYIVYSNKRIARFRPPPRIVRATPDPVPGDMLENPQFGHGISFRNLRCRLPCPKTLTFTPSYGGLLPPAADISPQNWNLAVGFYILDGSGVALAADQAPVNLSMTCKLTYTDA